jgi:predicted permease
MILVSLLLLIACANVANLNLARTTFRQREIGIRIALGAKPSRIVRQLLTESVLLSALGGSLGLLLARWGDAILAQMVGGAAGTLNLRLDTRILLFTLGVSMVVGILFGLVPALGAARTNLTAMLSATGAAAKSGRWSLGRLLVVTQIAFSLLLLIVAGLFVHSFQKLAAVELGYDREHLLAFDVPATAAGFKGAETRQLYDMLLVRLKVTPGVRGVTYSMLGLLGGGEVNLSISIDGIAGSNREMSANSDSIGPNYFTTIGIPIILGREIGPQDEGNGQRVGVINRTMAQYYFGDSNPIGRRISLPNDSGSAPQDLIIVGVVADAKYHAAKETPVRRFYTPFFGALSTANDAAFEIRSTGDPAAIADTIRATVKKVAPSLPTVGVRIINQVADRQLQPDLNLAKLSGFFSILAMVLASTGIYSLMSYLVARRTREVGIRMALGAQRGDVLRLVMSDTILLAMIGVLIGIAAAIGTSKLISSLLFGLGFADLPVMAGAALLMLVVAALAGYLPARRATNVDPTIALRTE